MRNVPKFTSRPKDFGIVLKIDLIDGRYEDWIRTLPCLVCDKPESVIHHMWHRRTNSYTGVPLCIEHHTHGMDAYHKLEHREFERRHKVCLGWAVINLLSYYVSNILLKGGAYGQRG